MAAEARRTRWANHRTTVAVQVAPDGWLLPDPDGDLDGEEAPWTAQLDGALRIACWREIDSIHCERLEEPVEGDG